MDHGIRRELWRTDDGRRAVCLNVAAARVYPSSWLTPGGQDDALEHMAHLARVHVLCPIEKNTVGRIGMCTCTHDGAEDRFVDGDGWTHYFETQNCAPLVARGPYIMSIRASGAYQGVYAELSYRPTGHHEPVAQVPTGSEPVGTFDDVGKVIAAVKAIARDHAKRIGDPTFDGDPS